MQETRKMAHLVLTRASFTARCTSCRHCHPRVTPTLLSSYPFATPEPILKKQTCEFGWLCATESRGRSFGINMLPWWYFIFHSWLVSPWQLLSLKPCPLDSRGTLPIVVICSFKAIAKSINDTTNLNTCSSYSLYPSHVRFNCSLDPRPFWLCNCMKGAAWGPN